MSILLHGDCLEEMKGLDDNSIDLIFCDLPYGQTSCKWDCPIDLDLFWIEVMRIKKLHTPIFMTTTTKFGVSLINSAPKKCFFRYDIIWVKSASAGFLSAKKMPLRKHEMIYVFYEKLPFYDLSSHKHKFIKAPLPVSIVKEETGGATGKELHEYEGEELCKYDVNKNTYGGGKEGRIKVPKDKKFHEAKYDPPLPNSVVKETYEGKKEKEELCYGMQGDHIKERKKGESRYDPPLPNSIVKEEIKDGAVNENYEGLYGGLKAPEYVSNNIERNKLRRQYKKEGGSESAYDPPLPNSMLEIKSTRGKHSTEKPVQLMEWILKYYSKEGDTVLDPTMGSGSTGVACKNMNRNFIGIEKDPEIYEGAVNRIEE